MAEWEGKSKGTVTGYKIFTFIIKKIGLNSAYFLLFFVSLYYCLFNYRQTIEIYKYFRFRRKNTFLNSIVNTYRNNYVFGQTLIDKVAITSGLENKFTYEFDGIELIHQLAQEQKGGVMISAHIGNFEVSQHFMDEFEKKIHLVTTDEERKAIKKYLESVTAKPKIDFIVVQNDMSHIFRINEVLSNEEIICFTGDRYFPGNKTLEADFLEQTAKFPAGPFLISSRLQCPVLFVYVMREKNKHYHFYARKAEFKNRDAQGLLESYIHNIEGMLEKYPLQWFNYYNFWK